MIRHLAAASIVAASTGMLASCTPANEAQNAPESTATSQENIAPLIERATNIVDQLMAGDYGSVVAEFNATMTVNMPEALLAETMTQLQGQTGVFQERTDTRQTEEAGYDVVFVTTVFEKATLNAKVVFDTAGKVAGLFFLPR